MWHPLFRPYARLARLSSLRVPAGAGTISPAGKRCRAVERCMGDDSPRPLTEEERVLARTARIDGGVCGWCGKLLAASGAVWVERVDAYATGRTSRWVPVGAECASPAFRAETEGEEPERCAGCGRGVYDRSVDARRRRASCSERCAGRHQRARAKEGRTS